MHEDQVTDLDVGIDLEGRIEGDFAWFDIKGNDGFTSVDAAGFASNDATNLRWAGSLRARGGIAADRLMLFFTGGWAYGDLQHTSTDPVFGIDRNEALTVLAG